MPFVLRTVRQARWYRLPWLAPDDVQADAYGDFQTKDNVVSVWQIQNDKGNLERVIAALAAGKDYSNIDYVLVEETVLPTIGIETVKKRGDTKDEEANSLWHFHLVQLSGLELWRLAAAIMRRGEIKRSNAKNVLGYLQNSVSEGWIPLDGVHEEWKKRF